ncbi:MAG: DNA polymerase III subunit alpha, partial [Actinobacteria bacterium]|nr:DNA polymerase III subunit alpha [Actinomycetota bacterium]
MADIATLVEKAKEEGQPALALTDHGNMSGAFQLYKACRKQGILPFVGLEAYVVYDRADKKTKRNHLSLIAYTTQGYQNLAKLSTLSNSRSNYHYKPLLDLNDLAQAHEQGALKGIVAMTGCYFGMIPQAVVGGEVAKAERVTQMLSGWFDKVFVEVQNHRTDHGDGWNDDKLVAELFAMANRNGFATIASQDSHYCDRSDKDLHNMMRMIAYSADEKDLSYPGDSYHLASTQWVKSHFSEAVWKASESSCEWLLERHSLAIPPLDSYKYFIPSVAHNPHSQLKMLCLAKVHQVKQWNTLYQERLQYELEVIRKLGMADYFILVNDYVGWCQDKGYFVMARGSAAGSLVCWLLGFTQVDPLKWKLSFERFLSLDRIRPPDIDLDIEDVRRDEVIEYLQDRYEITQIGTYNRLSYDEETGRGGLFVQYMSAKRKILGDQFARKMGRIENLHELEEKYPKDAERLKLLGDMPLRRSAGAHAAGFVVSAPPHHRIEDWIPTMLIPSSDTLVTQMMMDDVEDAGFVKIDLLGLRSLTTLRRCLENVNESLGGKKGQWVHTDWIPIDDERTFAFLRRGYSETGIFQLEGWTAAKGCREVSVKSVADLILVNALYRPATIDSGYVGQYLKNRKNPSAVSYPSPIFKKHLEETLGVPCFQEQVLEILRDLGMPVIELNAFLKAVKGKHAIGGHSAEADTVFNQNKAKFEQLCRAQNMDSRQIKQAWKLVEGFAAYGFNRSHATAYSLLGYQLAFLKTHHPLEFHSALLETTVGTTKEKQYEKETRRVGVKILPADVNHSGV